MKISDPVYIKRETPELYETPLNILLLIIYYLCS